MDYYLTITDYPVTEESLDRVMSINKCVQQTLVEIPNEFIINGRCSPVYRVHVFV